LQSSGLDELNVEQITSLLEALDPKATSKYTGVICPSSSHHWSNNPASYICTKPPTLTVFDGHVAGQFFLHGVRRQSRWCSFAKGVPGALPEQTD
jgi:hypothetical protein